MTTPVATDKDGCWRLFPGKLNLKTCTAVLLDYFKIVTPAWDTWQTTRFSVFARQSRVEVHTQRDLEDMLAKLDAPKGEDDGNDKQVVRKQRRKFAELAVPGVCLMLLGVVYSIVYLTNVGKDLAYGHQMQEYLDKLNGMEFAVHAVFQEAQARGDFHLDKRSEYDLESRYRLTDTEIHNVLPVKSTTEWRLISKIGDYRKPDIRGHCLTEVVMNDVLFYSQFILDLKQLINSHVLQFQEIKDWKMYYDFERHFQIYSDIKLNLIAISVFQELDEKAISLNCGSVLETVLAYATKVGVLLQRISTMDENSTFKSLMSSTFLSESIETISNVSKEMNKDPNSRGFSKYYEGLISKEAVFKAGKDECFTKMSDTNGRGFRLGIVYFVVIFLCTCVIGLCIYMFANILRLESRLVVGVSDWLHSVTQELDGQKEATDQILKKIVPRAVKPAYDLCTTSTMIPQHSSEATLLMCSIAKFNEFFSMFSAAQTLHILTLVMELLDERMEEYSVFPVTRMGSCQVVMSDYVKRQNSQHASVIANLALDIMTCCSDLEIGKHSVSKLQMKIGIHSGQNCGILFIRSGELRFHVTGMTCDILKKVHKTALPNRTQVSEATYKLLSASEIYRLHMRGNIKVKGFPQLKVYWLDGRRLSSGNTDEESVCSKIGSWLEFERKPLYRLDEEEGMYEPLDKCRSRRYSQMSMTSYNYPHPSSTDQMDEDSSSS